MRTLIVLVISFGIFVSPMVSAQDSSETKVCHITGRNFDTLSDDGAWPENLTSCKKGDVIAFDQEGTRLNEMIVAISRVCDINTVSMVNRNIPTAAVCIYTGKILPVISN